MNNELDKRFCKKYPKIFKNRYADMKTTAMCWGISCDDGWANIIDVLCNNIQHHIDFKRKQRLDDLRFNRALKRARRGGDKSGLHKYFAINDKIDKFALDSTETAIVSGHYKRVPEKIRQVVAVQVKEKFGGLRFYYDGGDEYIHGLVAMAESMSYVTCEVCGSPGRVYTDGWHATLCDKHAAEKNRTNSE
jgi:hypothetical protein